MNVEQFEIFRTIAQVRSFTKAAKILNFTQPAISSQIKILERHYNIALFERCNNGVKLTEAGKKFHEYGDKILALYEQMENDIASISGFNKEHISIGASYTAGNYYLPNAILAFKDLHPSTYVRLTISDSQHIISGLKDRGLDIGIVEGNTLYDPDLNICKIAYSELVLIMPVKHKWSNKNSVTIPELLEEPFISRENESMLRNYINNCLNSYDIHYDDLNIIMEITNFEAIKQAVINNKGISIVPYPVVERDLQQGMVGSISVEGLSLSWDVNVISRANESLNEFKKQFLNYIIQSAFK